MLQELGEKFHSAPALLKRLNPRAHFTAGEHIRVPNVLGAEPAAPAEARMVKVVVSKKASALRVYDQKGQIIFYAPVTSGSEHDPLPLGNWVITLVQRNPTYNYKGLKALYSSPYKTVAEFLMLRKQASISD